MKKKELKAEIKRLRKGVKAIRGMIQALEARPDKDTMLDIADGLLCRFDVAALADYVNQDSPLEE